MGIPDDVINSGTTGAWNGKAIPMQSFYSSLDGWVVRLLRDLCKQIIDPLLMLNFGMVHEYETPFKPLAQQAMEQQGEGDGGSPNGTPQDMQGNDPNQTGIPGANDQPQQQPEGDQNGKPIGMSLFRAQELVQRAKELSLLRLSVDTDESSDIDYDMTPQRIEALAEILASIFGDHAEEALDKILPEDKPLKLSVWKESEGWVCLHGDRKSTRLNSSH
mgnify:CR=1 FL=1